MILAGAHLILPDGILCTGHLRIEGGVISEVSGSAIAARAGEEAIGLHLQEHHSLTLPEYTDMNTITYNNVL